MCASIWLQIKEFDFIQLDNPSEAMKAMDESLYAIHAWALEVVGKYEARGKHPLPLQRQPMTIHQIQFKWMKRSRRFISKDQKSQFSDYQAGVGEETANCLLSGRQVWRQHCCAPSFDFFD